VSELPEPGAQRLDRLERWMLEVVSHPEGVEAGFAAARSKGLLPPGTSVLEDVVPGNARLGAVEQLAIYAHMYFGRIGDVLAEEFPTVVELFGRERFEALTRSYLVEHPSTSWTLDRVGLAFSAYLAARAAAVGELDGDSERLSFASALARVERAMDQVWNDPFEEALPYDELAAVPIERWETARLEPVSALRLLEVSHPVGPYMNAVLDGEAPPLPSPEPSWLVVFRRGRRRYRLPLDRQQFVLLSALRDGETLGDALEATLAVPGASVEQLLPSLGGWFQDWMGRGLFRALRLEPGA